MASNVLKWSLQGVGCGLLISSVIWLVDGVSRGDAIMVGTMSVLAACGLVMMGIIGDDLNEKENE